VNARGVSLACLMLAMDKPKHKPRSLYRRLSMTILAVVTLVAFTLSLADYYYLSERSDAAYQQKADDYSASLRDTLEWPLWNLDYELIRQIGQTFSSNPEVAFLDIRDDREQLVYHLQDYAGQRISRTIPIEHEGKPVGSVELGLSQAEASRQDHTLLLLSLLNALLLISALMLVLRAVWMRQLKKPIEVVLSFTRGIVAGQYRHIELPRTYSEFEPIVSALGKMSEAVANREEALRNSEERLKLATSAAEIGIWDWDIINNVLLWDTSMYRLYGIREGEFGGAYQAWIQALYPEDRDYTEGEIQAALRGEREYAPEFRIMRPDGSVRHIVAASKTYRNEAGQPMRMIGTNIDITARKQAEERLRESEHKLLTILDNTDAYIYLKDVNGRYLFANRPVRELWHAGLDEIVGWGDENFFDAATAENIRNNDQRVLAGGEILRTEEFNTVAATGEQAIYLSTKLPLRKDDGSTYALCGISVDITERKHAEEELRRYKDHLEEKVEQRTVELVQARNAAEAANRAKSLFLANMSHELRTPLNAILGFSEMIGRDRTISDAIKERVGIINRSGEHLLSMINDVLDLSKIDAGKVVVQPEAMDLPALIEDIFRMFEVRAATAGLRFSMELAPDIARYITVDGKKLRQVLINLLGNAVKFTQEGGFSLLARTLPVDGDPTALRLHLEVRDSGPGIPADQLEHLFKPFVQLAATASSQTGTGLGLSISKSLVELMGGRIGVESSLGKGALFWVDLPVAVTKGLQAQSAQATTPDVEGLAPNQPAWRILVAEDNVENRLLLVSQLHAVGFDVREAENGQEAVALFEQWQPHLIWMDIRMPVMDGYEATRRIRALPGGDAVKIVALTASAFREQRRKILDAGCNEVVHKPCRAHEIFETMATLIGAQYVYQSRPEEHAAVPPAFKEEMRAAAASLPEAVRSELIEAAQLGDCDRFMSQLKSTPPRSPALLALKALAEAFQFDQVLDVLNPEDRSWKKGDDKWSK